MIDDTLAGYRTVRAVGETARARVFLVHMRQSEQRTSATVRSAPGQAIVETPLVTRALKQFHVGTTSAQVLIEVECLSRASGSHIVVVDDLAASTDDKPIVVVQWVGAGSLRRLLRDRSSLRPGEAITVIAPLVGALSRVHQSGVAIGAVSVDAVHFDDSGCPFFTEFGFAQLTDPSPTPVELQLNQTFREDRRQLATLANSVLAAVSADREGLRSVRELADWLSDDANTGVPDWGQQLERRLFCLGAPEPLRLASDATDMATKTSSVVRVVAAVDAARVAPALSETRSLLALPPWLDGHIAEAVQQVQHRYSSALSALAAWCRPVRVRTWVLAAIGLICVIAAGAIVAIGATDSGDSTAQSNEVSSFGERLAPETPDVTDSIHELPADAEHALPLLLKARSACLQDLSVVCLESVSPTGTPAYVSDVALVNAVLDGGELPPAALFNAAASEETQQLGDSVLFEFVDRDTSKPASVLLVKGEAGWRIRSYTLPE